MKGKLKSAITALLLMCMTVPSSIAQTQATPRGLTEMVNNFTAVRTSFTIGPEASPDYLRGLEKRLDPKIVHTSNIVDSFKWTRYRNARTRKIIKYEYRIKYRISASQERKAQKRISQIASSARKIRNQKNRAKYIYGKVINGTKYRTTAQSNYTAYGALIRKKACCQGLSDALALICSRAGIKSQIISGISTRNADREAHMWVRLRIGGKWLYCDPTWDMKRRPYKFFLKSYAYFRRTGHIPAS